jgi:penicillin-binding protein 2
VGFAPSEDPSLALAVVIENAGSGGEAAAPVARAVFQAARDYGYFAGVQD